MDIRRIAPCMPGAEVTDVVDDATYKGRIAVRLGPVALAFAGVIKLEELDSVNFTARVKAQGSDAKGRGVGIIQATAAQIMTQFAANLKSQIAVGNSPAPTAQRPAAQPSMPPA